MVVAAWGSDYHGKTSSGDIAAIYTPDGTLQSGYPGRLLGVSPSGTKILVDDDTWIDLATGRIVDFAWYQDQEGFYFPQPIWSQDETRVYTCCYLYGDASTGASYRIRPDEISIDEKPADGTLFHSGGEWVLNDKYLLVQWDMFYDTNPGFIPLFDPEAKTYRNLNTMAGIPAEYMGLPNCLQVSPSPDGKYVWVECYDGDYLVNLATYETRTFPDLTDVEISWSADSQFALLENLFTDGNRFQTLSISNKELKQLTANPSSAAWHPSEPLLAYLSEDQRTLSLMNAKNGATQEVEFHTNFKELVWSPSGDQMALLAVDGSLWRCDYPDTKNFEQLTPPKPEVRDVAWSQDGALLAYIDRIEIYIVRVD